MNAVLPQDLAEAHALIERLTASLAEKDAALSHRDDEIERLAARPDVKRVILDLRRLAFLDSSGLRVVALAERRLTVEGRSLVLVRGPQPVQRVFEITRMTDRLEFVDAPEHVHI